MGKHAPTPDKARAEQLTRQYAGLILRLCACNGCDREQAREVARQVLLAAMLPKKPMGDEHLQAFIIRLAIGFGREQAADLAAGTANGWRELQPEQLALLGHILRLDATDRNILCLHLGEGYRLPKVGALLEITATDANARLYRTLEAARSWEMDATDLPKAIAEMIKKIDADASFQQDSVRWVLEQHQSKAALRKAKRHTRQVLLVRPRRLPAKFAAMAAACLVLAGAVVLTMATARLRKYDNLPVLPFTLITQGVAGDAQLYFRDSSDCVPGGELYEACIQAGEMPIYRNTRPVHYAENNMLTDESGYSESEMMQRVRNVAKLLEVEIKEVKKTYNRTREAPPLEREVLHSLEAMFDGGWIYIMRDGIITVNFDDRSAKKAPPPPDAGMGEHLSFMDFLVGEYGHMFYYMENPAGLVRPYYVPEAVFACNYLVYDASGSAAQQVANQTLNHCRIVVRPTTMAVVIQLFDRDLSQTVGNYPIWTADEALRLITSEFAYSDSPVPYPGPNHIAGVELLYIYQSDADLIMPYYKYYVDIRKGLLGEDGIYEYGTWFVPAVRSEFLQWR